MSCRELFSVIYRFVIVELSKNSYTWLVNIDNDMKAIAICVCGAMLVSCARQPEPQHLIVGTYTTPGKSEGIYVYDFDPVSTSASLRSVVQTANPSFVTRSPDGRYAYAVNELGDGNGMVSAFAFDGARGELLALNSVSSMGDHPCHIAIDREGRYLFVSNYSGGNLSVYRVADNGHIGELAQVIHYTGSGPNPDRQNAPHIHSAFFNPDETHLFVQDLGTDSIHIYQYQPENAGEVLVPAETGSVAATPGGGPRHIAFSPDGKYAYLVQELTARIEVYAHDGGKLSFICDIAINEPGFEGNDGAAHVLVSSDGKHVYASNRGDANTLAIYTLDSGSGELEKVGNQSVLGSGPRNFNLTPDGRFLLVGNHYTDEIVVFARDTDTGLLTDTGGRIAVGAPVCLVF